MTEAVIDISHIYIGLTFVPLINVLNNIFRITEKKAYNLFENIWHSNKSRVVMSYGFTVTYAIGTCPDLGSEFNTCLFSYGPTW
jgi:hypothetical protein